MIKPTVVNRSYTCARANLKGQSIVECRFPQPGEIAEIVAVSPLLSCTRVQAGAGKVEYGGRLVLSVVYSDESGKLCRVQKGTEFSHSLEDGALTPSQSCTCSLSAQKLSMRREGSSFVFSAVIGADICAYERRERAYIAAAEGAFLDLKPLKFCSSVPFSGESEEEDSFDADGVDDVLIPSARAVVLSVSCGNGEVEISGEVYLNLLAMRGSAPASLERTMPFKAVIPSDDAAIACRAFADVQVTQLSVSATVDEERGRCQVQVGCTLSYGGMICSCQEETAAVDAFSAENKLEIAYAEESGQDCGEIRTFTQRVSGLAACETKLGYDCHFLAVTLPTAECSYNPATGCAEGVVCAILLYEKGGEIKSAKCELPFAERLTGISSEDEEVSLSIAVYGASLRLRAEGETEAEATLRVCANVGRRQSIRYITSLQEGEPLQKSGAALSVCFPARGDGLWQVAKSLGVSPDEVVELNPDITYPLNGTERLVVYRGRQARQ